MAAVTLNNTPYRHVLGDLVFKIFNFSGASGSTLATGQQDIQLVNNQSSTSTGSTTAIQNWTVVGGTITFTSSGAMTNEVVVVGSRVG